MQQHVAYKTKITALQVQLDFLRQDSVEIVEFLKIIPWPNSFQWPRHIEHISTKACKQVGHIDIDIEYVFLSRATGAADQ